MGRYLCTQREMNTSNVNEGPNFKPGSKSFNLTAVNLFRGSVISLFELPSPKVTLFCLLVHNGCSKKKNLKNEQCLVISCVFGVPSMCILSAKYHLIVFHSFLRTSPSQAEQGNFSLTRYNLHTFDSFSGLKTIQWFLVHSQHCATIATINLRRFQSWPKRNSHHEHHSPNPSTLPALGNHKPTFCLYGCAYSRHFIQAESQQCMGPFVSSFFHSAQS